VAILASDSEREMSWSMSDDGVGWGLVFQSMDIHWPSLSKLSSSKEKPKFSKSVSSMISLSFSMLLLDIFISVFVFICNGEGMDVDWQFGLDMCFSFAGK